jgi:glycosyltransferase involved in cell wall biosynthesis
MEMTESRKPVPLSVVIIARNAENRIRDCLESVSWADEIVLVDSGSMDRTADIAREMGARTISHGWEGYVSQRRFALSQASHEWVLSLDADERVSPELAADIRNRAGRETADGYRISRLNHLLGKPIRHCGWAPDPVLRCFRKSKAVLPEVRVHEGFDVAGTVGRLDGLLLHYSYDTLFEYYQKMNEYTTLEAEDKQQRTAGRRIRWHDLILHPLSRFWRMYIARKGFLDGWHGFLVCQLSAFYLLVLYAKIWEMQRREGK